MENYFNNHSLNSTSSASKPWTSFEESKNSGGFGWMNRLNHRSGKMANWYSLQLDTQVKIVTLDLQGKVTRKQLLGLQPLLEYYAIPEGYTRVRVNGVKNLNISTLASLATLASKLERNGHKVIVSGVPFHLYQESVSANLHLIVTFE